MNTDDELLDDISRFGPKTTSLFVDTKGHQGDIIVEAGSLIWLNSIYGVDLGTFSYDTGFNSDLHEVAKQITDLLILIISFKRAVFQVYSEISAFFKNPTTSGRVTKKYLETILIISRQASGNQTLGNRPAICKSITIKNLS